VIPSKTVVERAVRADKAPVRGGSNTASGSSAALVILIAVVGFSITGVGLAVVLAAGYLLLGSSPKVEVAEAVPVEAAVPTATEILNQFAPPHQQASELTASAPPPATPISDQPPPLNNSHLSPVPSPSEKPQADAPIRFDFSAVPRLPRTDQRLPTTQPVAPRVESLPSERVKSETVRPTISPAGTLASVVPQAELPELASTAAQVITPHTVAQIESLRLRLISTAADIAEQAAIFTMRLPSDPLVWEVSYTADLQAEQPQVVPLGSLLVSPESISFQWREPLSDAELRRQLKNCVLVLEAENASAHVVLRKPISSQIVKLDLDREKQLQEFQITDLPAKGKIFAEVRGEGFPVDSSGGAIAKTLSVGPDEEFLFDRLPGAELGLRVSADSSGLNLTVAPRFREKGSLIPLSRPKLESTKKAMETTISRTKIELEEESQKIAGYQNAIRNLPNAPAGSPAAVARGIQLSKLERDIKRAANRISTLQRQLPAMEARLKAVPEVEKLIDQLDGKELTIEIYADCGEYRLPLVTTSRATGLGRQQQSQLDRSAMERQLAVLLLQ